jgi:Domain of unknown function (DUF397)
VSTSDVDRLVWRKSTFSESGNCVEVAHCDAMTLIRDSKNPSGAKLKIPDEVWTEFLAAVRAGEFDRLDLGD